MTTPKLIIFYPNNTAAVCDENGQLPQYQRGTHWDTITALCADGINWREIPERLGEPILPPLDIRPIHITEDGILLDENGKPYKSKDGLDQWQIGMPPEEIKKGLLDFENKRYRPLKDLIRERKERENNQ